MFKKIVVGMDGSERANHAFEVAADLARANQAGVTIAHVKEESVGRGGPIHTNDAEIVSALTEKAERLTESGIEAQVEVASMLLSSAGSRIANIAAETGADLIVVGTRGHSGVTGTLLGSVAHKLLSVAHVPVLVIPDPTQEPIEDEAENSAAAAR